MPKQPCCSFCGEIALIEVHPTYLFCNVCGRRTIKGKLKVEVPKAGENAPPGYGFGV